MNSGKHVVSRLAKCKIYCACGEWSFMPQKVNRVPDSAILEQLEEAFLKHQSDEKKRERDAKRRG